MPAPVAFWLIGDQTSQDPCSLWLTHLFAAIDDRATGRREVVLLESTSDPLKSHLDGRWNGDLQARSGAGDDAAVPSPAIVGTTISSPKTRSIGDLSYRRSDSAEEPAIQPESPEDVQMS